MITCESLSGWISLYKLDLQYPLPTQKIKPTCSKLSYHQKASISPKTMSSETSIITAEPPTTTFAVASLNFSETELTLGLPGESRNPGAKRRFSDMIDLKLGGCENSDTECSGVTRSPPSKERVIGWPPVRSYRRNTTITKSKCKHVKVAVDGAPYLRKLDLERYTGYQQLLCAYEDLFSCLAIRNVLNQTKVIDAVNGTEYVPTYEDKDGDWMLVGDVPWKMFVESCKRIRLMKSLEAINGLELLQKC